MSATKTFFTVSSVAVALIFGGGVYLYMNLGDIAKQYTEKAASQALKVSVSIGKMDISIENRKVVVSNIKVDNPPGYSKPHAVTISSVSVELGNLSQELINIKDISVGGTDVYLEVKGNGTNLNVLKENAQSAEAQGRASETTADAIKVILDRLAMTKATIHPSITLLEGQDLQPVNMPNIVLIGIGKKENGVLAKEAVAQVMSQVLKEAQEVAAGSGFLQGLSTDALKDIGVQQIQGVTDQLKGRLPGELGDNVGGEIEDKAKDAIKGLFGE